MTLLPAEPSAIARAAARLRAGGIVAFPTETVYGLGANALDARAVARIFEVKRRPFFDPLIVHVLDRAMLEVVAGPLPPAAQRLAEAFWPGALTIVLTKTPAIPTIVTAGLPTVAVRMPSHPVARALLAAAGLPLAAPSANLFGAPSPSRATHVEAMLGPSVDLILDAGATPLGIESTILAFDPSTEFIPSGVEGLGMTAPVLLRPGAIPVEAIEALIGPLERDGVTPILSSRAESRDRAESMEGRRAPGQLARHYAPATPLRLVEPAEVAPADRLGAGAITLRESVPGYAAVRVLSPSGDLREAAAKLFDALHELDGCKLERIDAQPVGEHGLGLAIMDRLRRAAAR